MRIIEVEPSGLATTHRLPIQAAPMKLRSNGWLNRAEPIVRGSTRQEWIVGDPHLIPSVGGSASSGELTSVASG